MGSVILAGLLLKLGGYGILRFLLSMEYPYYFFKDYVLWICIFSVLFASYKATVQEDMKRMIAYSSIAHMNFALLGIFSNHLYGYAGALCLMITHGIISPALFFSIGILYFRYGDRNALKYGGLASTMPLFITFLYLFILANFSVPLTSNFVGEFLIFVSLGLSLNKLVLAMLGVCAYYALVYSILLYNKVSFGDLKVPGVQEEEEVQIGVKPDLMEKTQYFDLHRFEFYVVGVLFFINCIFGVAPTLFLTYVYAIVSE